MKKIILIMICLFLAIMPSIPKVFATDEARSDESYIKIEPMEENVMMARGHGGYGGGPVYRSGPYHHHYHHGPRLFGCAPVPPPMY